MGYKKITNFHAGANSSNMTMVGIGNNDPVTSLDVLGDIRIRDSQGLYFKRHGDYYAWRMRNESSQDASTHGFDGANTLVFEVVSNSGVLTGSGQPPPSATSHSIYASSANTLVLKETGRVGIGTDAPSAQLEISSGAPTFILNANSQATNKKKIRLAASQYAAGDFSIQQMNDNGTTVATIAARWLSGGELVMGNTVSNIASNHNNQSGFGWNPAIGKLEIATTTNNAPMELSRNSANDGNWMTLRKQSNILGNIGTYGGTLYIGSTDGGLMFNGVDLSPTSGASTRVNNTVNIGTSTHKFKDLHLAGDTNIGGAHNVIGNNISRHNGVGKRAFSGTTAGNATFNVVVNHTNQSTFRITANSAHYGIITSYGCVHEGTYGNGSGGLFSAFVQNHTSGTHGGWTVTQVSVTQIRITKTAGTYAGTGYWNIIVEGANLT